MARDVIHSEEVVDGVISALTGADDTLHTGGLPAGWFEDAYDGTEVPLKLLEHGDLADYAATEELLERLPCILVRSLGPRAVAPAGDRGKETTEEHIRIIHLRHHMQCRDDSGKPLSNMTRARTRYARIIHTALFRDPHCRLATINADDERTEVTLTAEGGSARIFNVLWLGWDLGHELGSAYGIEDVARIRSLAVPMWAIACEIIVRIRTE